MLETLLPIAQAQAESHTSIGSAAPQLLLLIGFIAIFYFLIIRPQSKRAKAHKQLVSNLESGDEITTTGGLMGRVTKIHDNALEVELAPGLSVNLQKNHVTSTLPKGTIKEINNSGKTTNNGKSTDNNKNTSTSKGTTKGTKTAKKTSD